LVGNREAVAVAERQKTVSREASFVGPGLFSGETATLTFAPAAPNSGITFVREQDGKVATIPALVSNVLNRPRRTCLRNGTLFVETVEHCLAALTGMGVNNAVVTVSGGAVGELPGGDGSSRGFVETIEEAGVIEQDEPIEPLIIRKPIPVQRTGSSWFTISRPPRPWGIRRSASASAATTTLSNNSPPPARLSSRRRLASCAHAGWVNTCRLKSCW
jgi:UDP-3-O-[3-hydroxymyristoyl] N-acetylglucosamine deacetylase/3-hydroxyacyl-[acyl-carrier-protein] dehydratase